MCYICYSMANQSRSTGSTGVLCLKWEPKVGVTYARRVVSIIIFSVQAQS